MEEESGLVLGSVMIGIVGTLHAAAVTCGRVAVVVG